MTEGYHLAPLDLHYPQDLALLQEFLSRHHLTCDADLDCAFGLFDLGGRLAACGCAAKDLLKCFAVEDALRGQNALGPLVSALVQDRFAAGFFDLFIITRRPNADLFAACGFYPVVSTDALVLLESRPDGPEHFASPLLRPEDTQTRVGAIVMNADPFTLGHQALADQASAQCDVLHLFVVEEDRAIFPTDVRLALVRAGTAHLPNVRVHLSGRYMISQATFPTYFLKQDEDAASLHSQLDITLFAQRIAPALHITCRFAGQEPMDPVTARYNDAMREILPRHGIHFVEIPRVARDGQAISASRVRSLLRAYGPCPKALDLVPPTTRAYLSSHPLVL